MPPDCPDVDVTLDLTFMDLQFCVGGQGGEPVFLNGGLAGECYQSMLNKIPQTNVQTLQEV